MGGLGLLWLLLPLVVLALMVGGILLLVRLVRRGGGAGGTSAGRPAGASTAGHAVRRFFQYLLLLGLLVAAAAGVSGLVGRLLEPGSTMVRDDAQLALQLTFTLIALPLWGALALWTDRRLRRDPGEAGSPGWAVYLTLVGLVSLVVAMVAWRGTLGAAAGTQDYRGGQLATALVWTLVWAGHRWWRHDLTPAGHLRPERLLGTLVGLITSVVGAVLVLAASLREILGLTGGSLVDPTVNALLDGAAVLVVGAAAWTAYWLLGTRRGPRGTGWLALVLLAGVAGGLLMAVVAASILGWDVLVRLVGDHRAATLQEHFQAAPGLLAATLVGLLVWWHHREVLSAGLSRTRTEVRRVYEYLLAAVGLLAAAAGLVMILVTLVEAVAAGSDLVVGGSALNALLAALVLLAVGLPVWWWHWRQAQRERAAVAVEELASPTRRTYLLVLFGVMGVAAVVALLVLVYLFLEDALGTGIDLETMRRIRFPVGILATTSLLSAYHWTVFRADREDGLALLPARAGIGPEQPARWLLLVGVADPQVADELGRRTGTAVQLVRRTDVTPGPRPVEELEAAVAAAPPGDLLVIDGPQGLQVVPVER
ncbi:DUF5671 domain-containing protein [Ornithinimicrobium avium]|uniref:DUF5671 domain-containing protein n=1 Tax=Ornithinimicrobium avium TaxID=2283195 RepID=UPI0013B45AFE|nr:DUF5671 domain-containing protein [Ornithinimicrobium avium]